MQKTSEDAALVAFLQVAKLVGTGNSGASMQGASVAISADGNTAVVGGPEDNEGTGAVWIFTKSGTYVSRIQM